MKMWVPIYTVWLGIVCLTAVALHAQSGDVTRNRPSDYDDDDKGIPVRFPGSIKSSHITPAMASDQLTEHKGNNSEIPVSIFLNKDIKTLDDFIKNFVKDKPSAGFLSRNKNSTSLLRASNTDRNGFEPFLYMPSALPLISGKNENVASSYGLFVDTVFNELAPLAACLPEPTTIELEEPTDPAYIYFPPCTKIDRCGGCCTHPRLSCQPTQIENVDVKMLMMRFDPESDGFVPAGVKTVTLEKHNNCECRCSVKEEHCTVKQHYLPNECRCVCNNEAEMDTCIQPNKYWDPLMCSCTCREVHECSTGFHFDPETCTCKKDSIPNLVFRVSNDNFPRYRGEVYEIIEDKQTSAPSPPPKAAFRGK